MLSKSEIESLELAVIYYGDDTCRESWERIKKFLEESCQLPTTKAKAAEALPEGEICPLCKKKGTPSRYYCADCNNEFFS